VEIANSNAAVYGQLGRLHICLKWQKGIINMLFKISGTDNCILKAIYANIVHGDANKCWRIIELLCKYGFRDVWLYPQSVDVNTVMPIFKQSVKDCNVQA
jgi:hypothetical protein